MNEPKYVLNSDRRLYALPEEGVKKLLPKFRRADLTRAVISSALAFAQIALPHQRLVSLSPLPVLKKRGEGVRG